VNEFGLKAPDLIAPWIKEWSSRSDLNSLTLARDVLEMPFGRHCRGIDRKGILARVAGMESEMVRQISGWVREGKGRVEYFTIFADHVLTPVDPEERPGQYWADPYRGCQFRCEFCAARDISEYAGRSEEEFVRRVIVVANAAEVLAREIAQMQDRGDPGLVVHIGRSSDPFQPAEDKFQITREMLKILVGREVPVVVHTRSETVLRDLDVLERLAERNLVNVRIAIPTPIEGIRKKLELGVPSVTERLRVIGLLTRKNIPVGLTVSPIIPQLTDHVDPLDELIRRAADAGASFVVPEVLNLTGSARPKFRHFIETFLPSLAQVYEEIYPEESEGLHVDPDYVRRLTETVVPGIAEKYGANRTDLMLGRPVAAPTAG
jgi:DNA repair photolyase